MGKLAAHRKNKGNFTFTSYTNFNFKCIIDLTVKGKTIKHLEDNIRELHS